MKVFVVNCGSSSIKYQLFSMTNEDVLAKGVLERLGTDQAMLHHAARGQSWKLPVQAANHTEGLRKILGVLVDGEKGVIADIREIEGVGHRAIHGGEEIRGTVRINQSVLDVIRRNAELAPLHNPPSLAGIEGAIAALPHVPQVAVFDTAFLSTLPPRAHRYAVPEQWYTQHHVRKYGFHGTSHRYVTLRTAEMLGKSVDQVNLITVHLGNGCSMTAVAGGRAVDHSMGLTPLEGLVMGTRSGDIDPSVVLYMQSHGFSPADVDRVLNKQSGLLGVSGCSNDMRDLLAEEARGNQRAALALEMFLYRIAKYVGAYYTILPGCDAVVLTGGIGENSLPNRRRIVQSLARLGAELDEARNEATVRGQAGPITTDASRLAVWVVPTNEELMIARDTRQMVHPG